MTSDEFVKHVHRCVSVLSLDMAESAIDAKGVRGMPTAEAIVKAEAFAEFEALRRTSQVEVERYVLKGKYELKSDCSAKCFVPYQLAANFILSKLPPSLRTAAIDELKSEEVERAGGGDQSSCAPSPDGKWTYKKTPAKADASWKERPPNRFIQWYDADRYAKHGPMVTGQPRVPVFAVVGHEDHGKTSLVDALVGSRLVDFEAGGITQRIRPITTTFVDVAANVSEPARARKRQEEGDEDQALQLLKHSGGSYPRKFTLVDTPGHRRFAEMRLIAQHAADFVLLVIALDEGVQGQTLEIVKFALNLDRPVIVVLTKRDLYDCDGDSGRPSMSAGSVDARRGTLSTSVSTLTMKELLESVRSASSSSTPVSPSSSSPAVVTVLQQRVEAVLTELRQAGLRVTIVHHPSGVNEATGRDANSSVKLRRGRRREKLRSGDGKKENTTEGATQTRQSNKYLSTMYELSGKKASAAAVPDIQLSRSALGVVVSAQELRGIITLAHLMRRASQFHAFSTTTSSSCSPLLRPILRADANEPLAQAVVLDSTKQVVDFELVDHKVLGRAAKSQERLINNQERRMSQNWKGLQQRRSALLQPTGIMGESSSASLLLHVIVRSGTLRPGARFVVDTESGVAETLADYFGRPVHAAYPGEAVVIGDLHSPSGSPGCSIHVLEVPNEHVRLAVQQYRQTLQLFVRSFPQKLFLLRPRFMDASFRHLGDYGQFIEASTAGSLELTALYHGCVAGADGDSANSAAPSLSASSPPQLGKEKEVRKDDDQRLSSTELQTTGAAASTEIRADVSDASPSVGGGVMLLSQMGTLNLAQLLARNARADEERESAAHSATPSSLLVGDENPQLDDAWSGTQLLLAWRSLQFRSPSQQPKTKEEAQAYGKQCVSIGVLLKVNSFLMARTLSREIMSAGTSRVIFHVVSARYGELTIDEVTIAHHSAQIFVCFQTPMHANAVSIVIKKSNKKYIHTHLLSSVVLALRAEAVRRHYEAFGCDPALRDPAGQSEASGKSVVVKDLEEREDCTSTTALLASVGISATKGRRRTAQQLAPNRSSS